MKSIQKISLLFVCFSMAVALGAQSGTIRGTVKDEATNEPIEFANILLIGTDNGTVTDQDGNFSFEDLPLGIYEIRVSFIGYNEKVVRELEIYSSKPVVVNVSLRPLSLDLETVEVVAKPFEGKSAESPVSLRSVGLAEIRRNPGGNRDISRVIQSFPGVTSGISFRNDLLIRGGAPNENSFYLDEVEVPVINHFATQGASGGPAGIINVDFVREVDFYSGAFPVNRGNALSSVFNFKQKDGRQDRLGFTATLGASDAGVTVEGPIGNKSTFLFSVRRSYLQFLFKALGLPFLPAYTDFQGKFKTKLSDNLELTFIGLGAIDDFELNLDAADDEVSANILERLPVNSQWNYTNGAVLKRFDNNGVTTAVMSRSMLNNEFFKYLDNDDSDPDNLIADYKSQEIENKFRLERSARWGAFRWNAGVNYEYARYNNRTFTRIFTQAGAETIDYFSELDLHKYGLFAQISRAFASEKVQASLGFRIDGNTYSDDMSNPLEQFSPRASISVELGPRLRWNANTGVYYQLPPYTVLGYRLNNVLVNRENNVTYIRNTHVVTGFEYALNDYAVISLEGYYKWYANYPFLQREMISLANLGGDFGVIGNEPVISDNKGRTYGLEFLFQQRFYKGFYGILAYTLGRSTFLDKNGEYIPSSWDSRHILAFTGGKRFSNNLEIGVRWRFQTGLPFTPFDDRSSLITSWDRNGQGILDYDRLNTERTGFINGLDIRVTKKWAFGQWSLETYLDVQNVLANSIPRETLILDRPLDEDGMPVGNGVIVNPNDPVDQQRYALKSIEDNVGTVLPTIGIVISY